MRAAALLLLMSTALAAAENPVYLDLTGPWKVAAGDRPEYASSDFDDSTWATATLPVRRFEVARASEIPERGYWLRRSVPLPAMLDDRDLVLETGTLQDVFELYVNGELVGASGSFESFEHALIPRPHVFPIPGKFVQPGAVLHIAVRGKLTMAVPSLWRLPDVGPWAIVNRRIARNEGELQVRATRGTAMATKLGTSLLSIVFGLISLAVWRVSRKQIPLLWLGMFLFTTGTRDMMDFLSAEFELFTRKGISLVFLPSAVEGGFLAMFALTFTGRTGWKPRAVAWGLVAGAVIITLAGVPGGRSAQLNALVPPLIAIQLLVAGIVVRGWVQKPLRPLLSGRNVLFALVFVQAASYLMYWCYVAALVLAEQGHFPMELLKLQLEVSSFGEFRMPNTDLIRLAACGAMLWLFIRNWGDERREAERLAGEMEAARAVQQLLLTSAESGVEAVYQPAQEVGGDFFQVLPLESAARLVVLGDVSGKGLSAAMVVSMIVALVRTYRELAPGALLTKINGQLVGTLKGGFVTCLVVRQEADGRCVIANAGHLAPYSDGAEVAVEPGLPLGIAETEYAETMGRFERLLMLSDGVVEAAKADGELFGFERVREMSSKSAAEIAEAARAWGQNDDITVVTVGRAAA